MKKLLLVLFACLMATQAHAQIAPANSVWAGPSSGSAGFPTWRPLVNADLPDSFYASTFVCDGTTDNSAAFATQFAAAIAAGTPFRITADKTGGKKCVFNTLTTITSPGVDSNGQPPSALVYIDPGVSILFNGSVGWLKINGLVSGANDFRHSGVVGGNISVNPNGSTGTAYAVTLQNLNEAIVENVAFYNGLTGYTVGTSSNGLMLQNVYAGEVAYNFFFNVNAAVDLVSGTTGPTNYVKVHNNEFAAATVVAINSGGSSAFPNTANMYFNNYFEANNQHINIGQYENNFQIFGNYLNQGGCVTPCTSPSAYNGSDITVAGLGGIVSNNTIINSSDDQDINVTATATLNQVTQNYIGNNTLGNGSGAIVLASGSTYNIVNGNNFNGSIPGPNTPVFNGSSNSQIGVNYYPSSPGGIANAWGLAQGGTNNSLTPSNGGLVYSDATKLNILAGTSTGGQVPLSGATAAPSWSTFTMPSTFAANALIYASSANVLAALTTANNAVLSTNGSGVPAFSTTLPSGLTATNITHATINGAAGNSLTLNAASGQQIALQINGGNLTYFNGSNIYPNSDAGLTLGGASTNRLGGIYAALANTATTSAVCLNTSTGAFTYDATIGTCNTSDENLKTFDGPLVDPLAKLVALSHNEHFGYFYGKGAIGEQQFGVGRHIGAGAQTVARYFPELTATGSDGRMSLAYDKLSIPIINALAQLDARLSALEQDRK